MVRVLELVDQDEAEAGAQPREDGRPLAQQGERAVDLVPEVHEPRLAEQPLVRLVEGRELEVRRRLVPLVLARRGGEARLGPVPVLPGRDVLVLRAAHEGREGGQVARGVPERAEAVERQLEEALAEEDHLLRLREHTELRVEPGLERRLAQDPVAEGVERRDRGLRVAPGDELVDTLGHLGRGPLGEREREDLLGARALRGDEVRDPPRQDRRLAGAGARDDEQRALAVHDRLPLGVVEALEDALLGRRRRLSGDGAHVAILRGGPAAEGPSAARAFSGLP